MPEYTHLLIPAENGFRPGSEQVGAFVDGVLRLGMVPSPTISLARVDRVEPTTKEGTNPFTGELMVLRSPTRRSARSVQLSNGTDIAQAARGMAEYNVSISGHGKPQLAILPITFDGPYAITVRCCVRTGLASTSAVHSEAESQRPIRFGEDCTEAASLGLFTDPTTLELVEVPGAGCARFWIEFELGKSIFPEIEGKNLNVLNQQLVELASRAFVIQFLQGCNWCA